MELEDQGRQIEKLRRGSSCFEIISRPVEIFREID